MRIAVLGAGGMGGWLGARLAAAGIEVVFIARGEHLRAMQANGIEICGAERLHLASVVATDNTQEIGPVDAVLFCVKIYDTQAVANMLPPLMGPDTYVITIQNGVESAHQISAVIGKGRTLAGAAYFPANIAGPGKIEYIGRIGDRPHIVFGEPCQGFSERARAFARLCRSAKIDARVADNTEMMIWEKFCLVAATSAATAITRQTVGKVRKDPDLRWLLQQAISEAAQTARRLGVNLDQNLEKRTLESIDKNPPGGKASQLIDLERGRKLELEGLSGAVLRLGRQVGVATPVHATVYAALKPFKDGMPPDPVDGD